MREDELTAAAAVRAARRRAAKLLLFAGGVLFGGTFTLRAIPVISGDAAVTLWLAAIDTALIAGVFAAFPVERFALAAMSRRAGRAPEPREGLLRALTLGSVFVGRTPERVTPRFLRLSAALNFLVFALIAAAMAAAFGALGYGDAALWTFPATLTVGAAAVAPLR